MEKLERPIVYIVTLKGVKGKCKVGVTGDMKKRVSSLSTGSPFEIIVQHQFRMKTYDMAYKAERMIHDELRPNFVRGEWFDCSVEKARVVARRITREINGGILGPEYFIEPKILFGRIVNGAV